MLRPFPLDIAQLFLLSLESPMGTEVDSLVQGIFRILSVICLRRIRQLDHLTSMYLQQGISERRLNRRRGNTYRFGKVIDQLDSCVSGKEFFCVEKRKNKQ